MQFEVTRKKDNKTYEVHSVQMIMAQGPLGQPAPVVLFLIYDTDKAEWQLVEANEFVPAGVDVKEKKAVVGSSKIVL